MSYARLGECGFDTPRTGRLQVVHSLLAEHMTLDQASLLMGVSPRKTRLS